jgi:deoxycytidylate deaminase
MPRVICVGDPQQSLYRFRGADCRAFERIVSMLQKNGRNVSECQLPRNYRCDKFIIQRARKWVPELEGNSQALGTVDVCTFSEALNRCNNEGVDVSLPDGVDGVRRNLPLSNQDPVSFCFLCRTNKELIVTAYQLTAMGKRCCVLGRESFGEPLKQLVSRLTQVKINTKGEIIEDTQYEDYTGRISDRMDGQGNVIEEGLLTRLAHYRKVQSSKLSKEGYENKLETLIQNCECLEIVATNVKDDKVSSVLLELNKLFTDTPAAGVIVLSTIHRAKGGEWNVVFILRPDLLPFPTAQPNEDGSVSDELQQEYNACYVAATRAKNRLYYIENWPFGNAAHRLLNFDIEDILSVTQYPNANPEEYLQNPVETQYVKGTIPTELDDAEISEPTPYDKQHFVDDKEPF